MKMKKTIAAATLVAIMMLSVGATAYAGQDYYKKYKNLKAKYSKLEKKYKQAKKQRDDYGSQLEGTYMELVQCQRTLGGVNPWLEAANEKGGSQ